MAGIALSQEMVDALRAKLSYYKYQVAWGGTIMGPLNAPPTVEPDIETKETVLYETGVDPLSKVISKNNATITIQSGDVDAASALLKNYKKGDELLDSATAKPLVFTPLTSDEDAKSITFPKAYLQPGYRPNFAEGDDPNYVELQFEAKEDPDTGILFTYE
jgi:hypothetical protein